MLFRGTSQTQVEDPGSRRPWRCRCPLSRRIEGHPHGMLLHGPKYWRMGTPGHAPRTPQVPGRKGLVGERARWVDAGRYPGRTKGCRVICDARADVIVRPQGPGQDVRWVHKPQDGELAPAPGGRLCAKDRPTQKGEGEAEDESRHLLDGRGRDTRSGKSV